MFGLFMIEPYLSKILNKEVCFDARSYNTNVRGRIALIDSKTKLIKGFANLDDVSSITFKEYVIWHGFNPELVKESIPKKKYYSWNLSNIIKTTRKIKVKRTNRSCWINIDISC